jgi:cathepsin L
MWKIVFLFIYFFIVVSCYPRTTNLDDEWEDFKQRYDKEYMEDDEAKRRLIWECNKNAIEEHNDEYQNGLHDFLTGVNEYSDLTSDEMTEQMNGLKINGNFEKLQSSYDEEFYTETKTTTDGLLLATVDWRKEGYVTEVKNQKQCGSCWAFSATGSLEGQHFNATKTLVSLSEQNLVDCDKVDLGCGGGIMDNAFLYIKNNKGIDTEASYPYTAKNGKHCLYKAADIGATLTSWKDLPVGNEAALKEAVSTIGPISVGIDASRPTFHNYKSGVYYDQHCSSTKLDHGVLVVGYGTDKESGKEYWLVKNSWGKTWGNAGYIKMARNRKNACGISTHAVYPIV